MDRIIKFEYGFESVNGVVKKVYHLHEIPNIAQICDVWDMLPIKYVRQFTGLKDKNGKEIFEGDIVKKTTYPQLTFIVKFDKGKYNICGYKQFSLKVIGNIHQNEELIIK
jgi:hypothetical protein